MHCPHKMLMKLTLRHLTSTKDRERGRAGDKVDDKESKAASENHIEYAKERQMSSKELAQRK